MKRTGGLGLVTRKEDRLVGRFACPVGLSKPADERVVSKRWSVTSSGSRHEGASIHGNGDDGGVDVVTSTK